MKTLIKLVIAAIVLNALVRTGLAASSYYQFKDATQQVIVFGTRLRIDELHREIMTRAGELELPLDPADVVVRRDGLRTIVEGSYTQSIELFPNYLYPYTFTFDVEARGLNASTADAPAAP